LSRITETELRPWGRRKPALRGDGFRRYFYIFRVSPEPLEIVVGTGFLEKDMDDEVAVVHQDPLGVLIPFHADRQIPAVLELEVNFVRNGLVLPDIRTGADDEIIGEGCDFA